MNYFDIRKKNNINDFVTDFTTLAPDSIRYPPSANIPKGLVNTPKLKERLSKDGAALTLSLIHI